MDWLEHLQEELRKDLELLKELEDNERYESNPLHRGEIKIQIEELKKRIKKRNQELSEIPVTATKLSNSSSENERHLRSDKNQQQNKKLKDLNSIKSLINLTIFRGKSSIIITLIIVSLLAALSINLYSDKLFTPEKEYNVVLMDTAFPKQVYDPETRRIGGTNADDIYIIMKDIQKDIQNNTSVKIKIVKELTNINYSREEEIVKLNPSLVILHLSCFYDHTNLEDSDRKFRNLITYLVENSESKFLIYTRGLPKKINSKLQEGWNRQINFLNKDEISDRAKLFIMPNGADWTYEDPHGVTFKNPDIADEFKMQIKYMLGIKKISQKNVNLRINALPEVINVRSLDKLILSISI